MASYVVNGGASSTTSNVYTLASGDTIYVTPTGTVWATGGFDGIAGADSDNITVTGSVYGDRDGISAGSSTFLNIGATGVVSGISNGIYASGNYSYINNSGSILARNYGIFLNGNSNNIINSGTISSVYFEGIELAGYGNSISNSGTISASDDDAIYGYNNATGYTETLNNSGTITADGYVAVSIYSVAGGYVNITNSGTIQSTEQYAITTGAGVDTVKNSGTITGDVYLNGGDDLFDGSNGITNGIVYGDAGDDTLYGSNTGNDVLDGGAGYDYLNGGGGSDTAYYFDASSPDGVTGLTVSLTDPNQNTGDAEGDVYVSIENLGGTQYNDSLTGDANANTINGYGGDDSISGAAGADVMIGGSGDDTYYVDNAGDSVIEKVDGGNDRIISSVSYSLHGRYVETLTLSGTGNINATGNDLANTLNGNTGNNVLDGKGGVDTMSGGLGDDTYYVDDSNDNVVETSTTGGNDAVFSSVTYNLKGRYVETLTLTGTADINATGNNSINTLVGNSGANILDGQGGNDTLTGGGGADIFLFDTALSGTTNVDTITDFSVGTDLIQLDKAIFTALGADGALSASAFGLGTAAATTGQRILYNSSTGDIFYDKDGTGSAAAVKFAHVAVGTALTASSFSITG